MPVYSRPFASTSASTHGRVGVKEVKSFDEQLGAAAALGLLAAVAGAEPAAAFTGLTEVNCIPQDATVAGRIGNKVVIRSLHCKFNLTSAAAVLGTARAMLVYDRQPTGAFPAIASILTDLPAAAASPFGGLNISNKSRFSVIRDEFIPVDAAQQQVVAKNWYCKGRWEVEFGANAGTIGDFRTGAIYFICFSAYAAGGVITVTNQVCRSRYYD